MTRLRLIDWASAVALVACAAITIGVWVRAESFKIHLGDWCLVQIAGNDRSPGLSDLPADIDGEGVVESPTLVLYQHGFLGFQWGRWDAGESYYAGGFLIRPIERFLAVRIPLWFIILMIAALPIARASAMLWRHRQLERGRCVICGYNLTCNVSGVCPECGSIVSVDQGRNLA